MPVNHLNEWIPNIVIGQDYDRHYENASLHFDVLGRMADFFGRDMPVHLHARYLQIHFIEGGESHFYIDDQVYHCQGACCFLTPPSVPHSFMTEPGVTGYVLTLHESLLWQLLHDSQHTHLEAERVVPIGIEQRQLDADGQRQWQRLALTLESVQDEWNQHNSDKRFALETLVRLLLLQLLRLAPAASPSQIVNSEELRQFRRFSELIEREFRQRWPLIKYCAAIGVSESHLNHICQRVANCPPKRLIHDRMLQESKRLLRYSSHTINDIGYQLGFTDPSYFSRFFRKQAGITPKGFREQERGLA